MNMDRDDVRGISDTHLSAVASCCPRRLPMSQTRGRATPGTSNWVKVEATTSLGHLRSRLPSLRSPTNTQKTFDESSAWNFRPSEEPGRGLRRDDEGEKKKEEEEEGRGHWAAPTSR